MAAVKGHYGAGKSSSIGKNGVSHGMGKKSGLASRTSVTAAAGKNSGAARGGDKSSAPHMGMKGGKSG